MQNENQIPLTRGMQYQLKIYMEGADSKKPSLPVAFEDLEQRARETLSPEAFGYIAGAAGGETTMMNNKLAYNKWQILPRMMTDTSECDISVELFGKKLPSPILLGPIGVLSIAHREAEVAVARASKALQVPQIVSSVSSKSMEEVADVHGEHPHWFQLYWGKNDDLTRSFIQRAEKSGYEAIVVTVDTRIFAWRERDIQNAYLPFLYREGMENYLSDPVFQKLLGEKPDPLKTLIHFANCFSNPGSSWSDLAVIRDATRLPVLVKGLQHPDDARKAIDHGADGIIVSNHGGRQCDGAIAALDILSDVVDAVGNETTILFDSGIRRGADVFKAMALGAKSVLVARSYAYGLALRGEHGVAEVVGNLLADTQLTLGIAGYNRWSEVTKDALRYMK